MWHIIYWQLKTRRKHYWGVKFRRTIIFNHLKLCLADAIHNSKWLQIMSLAQSTSMDSSGVRRPDSLLLSRTTSSRPSPRPAALEMPTETGFTAVITSPPPDTGERVTLPQRYRHCLQRRSSSELTSPDPATPSFFSSSSSAAAAIATACTPCQTSWSDSKKDIDTALRWIRQEVVSCLTILTIITSLAVFSIFMCPSNNKKHCRRNA